MGNQEENKEALGGDNPQGGTSTTTNNDEATAHIERLKQQLAGSSQEAVKLKDKYDKTVTREIERVTGDNSYLLELSEKDPELAADVARRGWNLPLEKALEKISGAAPAEKGKGKEEPLDTEALYKQFSERLRNELASETARASANQLFGHLQGDEKVEAENLFKEMTAGRTLTNEEAQKFAEMATLYAQKGKIVSGKADLNLAMFGSTGSLGRSTSQPAPETNKKDSGEDLAASLGLGHLYSKK